MWYLPGLYFSAMFKDWEWPGDEAVCMCGCGCVCVIIVLICWNKKAGCTSVHLLALQWLRGPLFSRSVWVILVWFFSTRNVHVSYNHEIMGHRLIYKNLDYYCVLNLSPPFLSVTWIQFVLLVYWMVAFCINPHQRCCFHISAMG